MQVKWSLDVSWFLLSLHQVQNRRPAEVRHKLKKQNKMKSIYGFFFFYLIFILSFKKVAHLSVTILFIPTEVLVRLWWSFLITLLLSVRPYIKICFLFIIIFK